MALAALAVGPLAAVAADNEATTTTTNSAKTIGGTRVIINTYNAFGNLVSSKDCSDEVVRNSTTTKTTQPDGSVTNDTSVNYTVQHTETTTSFIGGSQKVVRVAGYVASGGDPAKGTPGKDNPNADGSWSKTEFCNIYQYDQNGRLVGVTGGIETKDENGKTIKVSSLTKGNRGKDSEGKELGAYESYTIETYEVRNGQALKTKTETYSKNYGVDSESSIVVSKTHTTSTFEYDLMGGSWVLTSVTEKSRSDTVSGASNGSYNEEEKVTTYHRNADGTLIDDYTLLPDGTKNYKAITIELKKYTSHTANGQGGFTDWKLGDYKYVIGFDEQQGYYLKTETITQSFQQ